MKTNESKPWERQECDTKKSFEAFCIYRDMGEERSLRKVAEQLQKSEGLINRWSRTFNWVDRCAAWDAEVDRLASIENLRNIRKMRKRHAEIAVDALEKVSEALGAMDIYNVRVGDLARLLAEASKLERISRGDSGDVVEERDGGKAISPVQIYLPDNGRENTDADNEENTDDDEE